MTNAVYTDQEIAEIVGRATGLALQTDALAAVELLETLPDTLADEDAAQFRRRMIQRFRSAPALPSDFVEPDVWMRRLATIYVTYWHAVFTRRQAIEDAERDLEAAIGLLLGREQPINYDELEAALMAEVTRRGFHLICGRTLPLLELMVWKQQETVEVEVQLPEGTHPMTVTYLDEFVLRGWGNYATCGRRGTGGWATAEGLFAVVPAYQRMDDEAFSIHFLGHEAQHSVDLQWYEGIESWELEYRAKLTELVLSHETQPLTLTRFCENRSGATKQAPHAYANDLVIRNLEERLSSPSNPVDLCRGFDGDPQQIRDAARALLIEDTQSRSTTKG